MFQSDVHKARFALVALTVVWGSTFVVNQTVLREVSSALFVTFRFVGASLVIAIARPNVLKAAPKLFLRVLPLSIATAAGFLLQTGGLNDTTPSRSAFLTALFVVFVPMLEALRDRKLPALRLLGAVVLALAGVWALFPPEAGAWRRGDTMTLLCAIAFAVYVMELDRLGKSVGALEMTFVQFASVAVMSVPFVFVEPLRFAPTALFWSLLLYSVFPCTLLAIVLSAKYQHFLSPTEASVMYSLEPIFATALSILVGRELFNWHFVIGGTLVFVATIVAAWRGNAETPEAT